MDLNWKTSPYQEYIDDIKNKNLEEIAIQLDLIYKTLTDNFFFKYKYYENEINISWTPTVGKVQLLIEDLQIPKALFEDLKKGKGRIFIISIINQILPIVNNHLDYQKYNKGNILMKRVNFLDIFKITLIYHQENRGWQPIFIPLPIFPKEFPPLQQKYFQNELPPIYIRDYIDAMESYLNYNFSDCVRKIITSLENCFRFYKLKVKKLPLFLDLLINRKHRIPRLISKYIQHPIIRKNLLFLYRVRNKIVHEGFIIKPEHGWFCKKGIGTLSYVFQESFISNKEKEYLWLLTNQFLLITNEISGFDLIDIAKWFEYFNQLSESEKEKFVIKSENDFNEFIFSNLEITEKEKHKILKL
jgi:hypothetical protein